MRLQRLSVKGETMPPRGMKTNYAVCAFLLYLGI